MGKTNKKNIYLGLGVVTILGITFGTSTALYFSAGQLESIAKKREYKIRNNTSLSLDGYYFDTTASYGQAKTKSTQSLMNSNLIRVQTTGETKFAKNSKGETVVKTPSGSKLVLELAKEMILTFKSKNGDTQKVIFNSDESNNIKEEVSNIPVGQKIPETISLKSNNKLSINSDYFDKLLNGVAGLENNVMDPNKQGYILKSIGFTVKENIPWVYSNGKKTNYKVKVEDFWYSYMRTWLFDTKFRRKNGGSKELDTYFINKTSTTSRFQDQKEYPNDYLLDLFGVNSKSLQNKDEAITYTTIGEKKDIPTFTMVSKYPDNSNEVPKFKGIINKIFLNSFLIPAAPSAFIDELSKKTKDVEYDGNKITGLAQELGIYTYGQKRSDNLFASAFVPISGADNRIVFKKNKFFANSDFVNDKNTLDKIIFEFSSSASYNDQLFTSYFEKTVSEMAYTDLTEQQKKKVFGGGDPKEALNNGLLQVKQLNKSNLVQRTLLSTDPRKLTKAEKDTYFSKEPSKRENPYLFNNAYSKLVYGAPIAPNDINDKKTPNIIDGTAQTANSFFNGSGFQLRTLLNAAINWYTFINNSWKGTKVLWLNHTAPNANYNDTLMNAEGLPFTPVDAINRINTINYFNGGKKEQITEQDMKKVFDDNLGNADEQFKTNKFEDIKKIIKKLLDVNVPVGDKLEWAITYPYADATTQTLKIQQLEKIIKTIKSLDSRLNPYLNIPNDPTEMLDSISQNKSISDYNGWGYDYDGIGTFLDGISHGVGISLLGAFSLYSDPKSTAPKTQFPEFTKLSEAMKESMDGSKPSENQKLPIGKQMKDWINLTNNDNNTLDSYFGDDYKIGIELAKFFVSYQIKLTEKEITDLIIELNSIAGFAMESDNSINDLDAASLSLVLSEYYYPTTEDGVLYLSDIRVGDKDA